MDFISVFTTIAFIILIGFNIYLGMKKNFASSVVSIVLCVISTAIAFFLTKAVVNVFSDGFANHAANMIYNKYSDKNGAEIAKSDSANVFVRSFGYVFFSTIIYAIIFIISFALLHIPGNKFKKNYFSDEKHCKENDSPAKRFATPFIRALSGFIAFITMFSTLASVGNRLSPNEVKSSSYERNVSEYIKPLTQNKLLYLTAHCGGNFFAQKLTNFEYKDVKYDPLYELSNMLEFSFVTSDLLSNEKKNNYETAARVKHALSESESIPNFLACVTRTASGYWIKDDDFWGREFKIKSSHSRRIYKAILDITCNIKDDEICNEFSALVDIVTLIQEYNLIYDSTSKNFINAISDYNFTWNLLLLVYNNPKLNSLLPVILYEGFGELLDYFDISIPDFTLDDFEEIQWSLDEIIAGAAALVGFSNAVIKMDTWTKLGNISDIDVDYVLDIIDELVDLSNEYELGDYLPALVVQVKKLYYSFF